MLNMRSLLLHPYLIVPLNKKHDCNNFIINSIYVNCANNMQNPKLGDASFAMSTTCCNDHDWRDFLMILKIYLIIMVAMILKAGLEDCKL